MPMLRIQTDSIRRNSLIKTKSIYDDKSTHDGKRILITRYYPRGVKKTHFHEWRRELAPSSELLKEYKNGEITWRRFQNQFLRQMKNADSKNTILNLAALAKNKSVTLLCYEKDGENCHRHLLQELISCRM